MYTYIEQKVEQLFADALRQYSNSKFCENPVTGECFVPRHDPIKPHKERAIRALVAHLWFATQKPADAPDLPLDRCTRAALDREDGLSYLVAAFGYSLNYRDFFIGGHPDFGTFARGVMASARTREVVRNDPDLRRRYPPKPLKGLEPGLVFELK